MFKSLMTTGMGRTTIYSGLIAFVFPVVMIWAKGRLLSKRKWQVLQIAVFFIYVLGILYLTLGSRDSGDRNVNLMPFWTYAYFSNLEYRWEIYMNVFLFIPFGFLLAYVAKRNLLQSLMIGLVLSACIEAIQYLFCLGMCEFDDVFHNTLGTAIGFGYWKAFYRIRAKHGKDIRIVLQRARQFVWKLWTKGVIKEEDEKR